MPDTNIPKGWKMTTLGEAAELSKSQWSPGNQDYKYIGLEHINQDDLTINGFGFSSKLESNKFYFKKNDVLFGKLRPYFRKVWKAKFDGVCSTDIWVIHAKEGNSQDFIFYFFANPEIVNKSTDASIGTRMPRADWRYLRNLEYSFPPLLEQRAIAAALSSLDDKIELLREQNKTLEAIAQAVYKQWFVDFEFPDEHSNPYKSSGGKMVKSELGDIPEVWRVGYLGDNIIASLLKTGIDNFEGEKIYLDTASVQGSNIVDLKNKIIFRQRPSRANMQPKINSIWFAKMKNSKKALFFDIYSEWELDNFILSTGFAGLDVKGYALYYLWNFIISDRFELEKDNFCNGTTMQAINNENIQKMKILIPAEEILILFSNIVRPLYQKVHLNWMSIQILSALRDSLLPKLISGKIRVPTTPSAFGCHPSLKRRGVGHTKDGVVSLTVEKLGVSGLISEKEGSNK